MARSTFVYVAYIRTTPEKLWTALTDAKSMKQYWFGNHAAPGDSWNHSSVLVPLEIKSDNVEQMTRKMLDFGLTKLEVPDPHLYFQGLLG